MVEHSLNFDLVFQALSDSTRRDILTHVLTGEQRITDLARRYSMSFAGVAKHLEVLAKAKLVTKRRKGREQMVSAGTESIKATMELLEGYEKLWSGRFDRLEVLLKEDV
ncbi:MAG TPA: metalloregulator ArsR/SmtB family transcription factor [Patescibacteria group bacterium]|jgi:DNA-binding transcriptional ArsR family regulator|nr:metalloregulator ArsR/SmtB family transcription factor [Patescibacteria group bacterium]